MILSGTGSSPPFERGLHLIILINDKSSPFRIPCFIMACREYSEQVGEYRQPADVTPERRIKKCRGEDKYD